MKMYNIKNQKGAISLFVLLSMMFFLTFMLGAFTLVSRRNANQAETLLETQKIYSSKPSAGDRYDEIFSSETSSVPITSFEQLENVKRVYDSDLEEKYFLDGKVYTYSRNSNYILNNNIVIKKDDYEDDQNSLRNIYETYSLNASNYNLNLNGYIFFYERHDGTIGKLDKFINSDAKELAADNRNIGKAVNYGVSYVDASVESGQQDSGWQILYADNNNVYIITTGFLYKRALTTPTTGNTYNGTSDFLDLTRFPAVSDGWLNKIYGTTWTSSYSNMKVVEYLLDSTVTIWSELANSYARWAIGAPTMELLVASYNAVNTPAITISNLTPGSYGYGETISSGLTNVASKPWNHGESYWLACPSSDNANYIRRVVSGLDKVDNTDYYGSFAIRPVVCLKSDIGFEWNDTTNKYDLVE